MQLYPWERRDLRGDDRQDHGVLQDRVLQFERSSFPPNGGYAKVPMHSTVDGVDRCETAKEGDEVRAVHHDSMIGA